MDNPLEKKRGMVQMLMSMLKKHAADEVDSGLKKPEGEGDMHGVQDEKVEVLPEHEMDRATPVHEVDTKLIDEGKATSNDSMARGGMAYNKGGVVDKVNATDPTPKIHSGPIPYESDEGHPDTEGSVQEEASEPLEERESEIPEESMHSAFETFLKKKKK